MKTTLSLLTIVSAIALGGFWRAEAQQPGKVPRVGFLALKAAPTSSSFFEIFRQGLRELGYIEGKNVIVEYWSRDGRPQLTELAARLIQNKVDVIVTAGGTAAPAKSATATVPIVFTYSGDPIEAGFIDSLARPGRNMTGITWLAFELVGKRLDILKEAFPRSSRVAVLANPRHPGEERELSETQSTARSLGITLLYHQVRSTGSFDTAFDAIRKQKATGLVVFPDSVTLSQRVMIADFAVKQRLPSMFGWKEYVEAGGLMSYGPDREETLKRLAVYVDKILKGRKPTDLPVELPKKFDFIVNLKTAKQMGLTIPPNLLVRADRVIK